MYPSRSLRDALQNADRFHIFQNTQSHGNGSHDESGGRMLVLENSGSMSIFGPTARPIKPDPSIDPGMLPLLKTSGRFPVSRPKALPDFRVYADFYNSNEDYKYHYISATGELGSGREWCRVPEAFKAFVLSMKAKLPERKSSDAAPISNTQLGIKP